MSMDISISIVSYNTSKLLERCIRSIFKYTKGIKFEVIVVDNNSSDESVQMLERKFSQVTLIKNKANKYYTGANNQSLKIAKGKYFLILNSDTYFIDNSIKKMIDYMEENSDVGACEGLEIYEDGADDPPAGGEGARLRAKRDRRGRLVPTGSRFSTPLIDFYELSFIGKRFKNRKMIDKYRIVNKKRDELFDIDVGCDAFLMVHKNILDKVGGYDEKFLLYYTENDLCLRIKKLGYKIVHLGNAKVIHTVSASVKKLGFKKMDIYYQDMLWYYRKHGYILAGTLLYILLKLEGVVLRIIR